MYTKDFILAGRTVIFLFLMLIMDTNFNMFVKILKITTRRIEEYIYIYIKLYYVIFVT